MRAEGCLCRGDEDGIGDLLAAHEESLMLPSRRVAFVFPAGICRTCLRVKRRKRPEESASGREGLVRTDPVTQDLSR